ncbi:MAG: tat pathway signal sequence [Segniliparus sp.]|uniref:tat pathway signal sequence n=1 Tax=Segniliparus sp. TaxID=2804064 RepID=UPI003F36E2C8
MGNKRLKGFAALVVASAALAAGPQAAAAPDDLPANADLGQFYPSQTDLPDGWSLGSQNAQAVPSADSTTPAGCAFLGLFPATGSRTAEGPGRSFLRVHVLHDAGALRTVLSWREKCASFTMLGGGGTTGKNWMSVESAEPPDSNSVVYRITGQGPFVPPELEVAGSVRGVLVLVSQSGPADDGLAADVYRATAAKINEWRR